jgi:putative transposase
MSAPDRRAKLDRNHPYLSIRRQCAMLGIARSGVYRPARAANDNELALLRRIDELFTRWPFLGSRRMTAMLRAEGQAINRKRVQRLMRRMGIAALGPKPRTTKPAPGHAIYPYLLRDVTVERTNQVWAADITYTNCRNSRLSWGDSRIGCDLIRSEPSLVCHGGNDGSGDFDHAGGAIGFGAAPYRVAKRGWPAIVPLIGNCDGAGRGVAG